MNNLAVALVTDNGDDRRIRLRKHDREVCNGQSDGSNWYGRQ